MCYGAVTLPCCGLTHSVCDLLAAGVMSSANDLPSQKGRIAQIWVTFWLSALRYSLVTLGVVSGIAGLLVSESHFRSTSAQPRITLGDDAGPVWPPRNPVQRMAQSLPPHWIQFKSAKPQRPAALDATAKPVSARRLACQASLDWTRNTWWRP